MSVDDLMLYHSVKVKNSTAIVFSQNDPMDHEINDAAGRANYVQALVEQRYPIFCIAEENYSDLADDEEGSLYQIVLASTHQIARIKSYLGWYVEKSDPLDMESYKDWINRLYEEWFMTMA